MDLHRDGHGEEMASGNSDTSTKPGVPGMTAPAAKEDAAAASTGSTAADTLLTDSKDEVKLGESTQTDRDLLPDVAPAVYELPEKQATNEPDSAASAVAHDLHPLVRVSDDATQEKPDVNRIQGPGVEALVEHAAESQLNETGKMVGQALPDDVTIKTANYDIGDQGTAESLTGTQTGAALPADSRDLLLNHISDEVKATESLSDSSNVATSVIDHHDSNTPESAASSDLPVTAGAAPPEHTNSQDNSEDPHLVASDSTMGSAPDSADVEAYPIPGASPSSTSSSAATVTSATDLTVVEEAGGTAPNNDGQSEERSAAAADAASVELSAFSSVTIDSSSAQLKATEIVDTTTTKSVANLSVDPSATAEAFPSPVHMFTGEQPEKAVPSNQQPEEDAASEMLSEAEVIGPSFSTDTAMPADAANSDSTVQIVASLKNVLSTDAAVEASVNEQEPISTRVAELPEDEPASVDLPADRLESAEVVSPDLSPSEPSIMEMVSPASSHEELPVTQALPDRLLSVAHAMPTYETAELQQDRNLLPEQPHEIKVAADLGEPANVLADPPPELLASNQQSFAVATAAERAPNGELASTFTGGDMISDDAADQTTVLSDMTSDQNLLAEGGSSHDISGSAATDQTQPLVGLSDLPAMSEVPVFALETNAETDTDHQQESVLYGLPEATEVPHPSPLTEVGMSTSQPPETALSGDVQHPELGSMTNNLLRTDISVEQLTETAPALHEPSHSGDTRSLMPTTHVVSEDPEAVEQASSAETHEATTTSLMSANQSLSEHTSDDLTESSDETAAVITAATPPTDAVNSQKVEGITEEDKQLNMNWEGHHTLNVETGQSANRKNYDDNEPPLTNSPEVPHASEIEADQPAAEVLSDSESHQESKSRHSEPTLSHPLENEVQPRSSGDSVASKQGGTDTAAGETVESNVLGLVESDGLQSVEPNVMDLIKNSDETEQRPLKKSVSSADVNVTNDLDALKTFHPSYGENTFAYNEPLKGLEKDQAPDSSATIVQGQGPVDSPLTDTGESANVPPIRLGSQTGIESEATEPEKVTQVGLHQLHADEPKADELFIGQIEIEHPVQDDRPADHLAEPSAELEHADTGDVAQLQADLAASITGRATALTDDIPGLPEHETTMPTATVHCNETHEQIITEHSRLVSSADETNADSETFVVSVPTELHEEVHNNAVHDMSQTANASSPMTTDVCSALDVTSTESPTVEHSVATDYQVGDSSLLDLANDAQAPIPGWLTGPPTEKSEDLPQSTLLENNSPCAPVEVASEQPLGSAANEDLPNESGMTEFPIPPADSMTETMPAPDTEASAQLPPSIFPAVHEDHELVSPAGEPADDIIVQSMDVIPGGAAADLEASVSKNADELEQPDTTQKESLPLEAPATEGERQNDDFSVEVPGNSEKEMASGSEEEHVVASISADEVKDATVTSSPYGHDDLLVEPVENGVAKATTEAVLADHESTLHYSKSVPDAEDMSSSVALMHSESAEAGSFKPESDENYIAKQALTIASADTDSPVEQMDHSGGSGDPPRRDIMGTDIPDEKVHPEADPAIAEEPEEPISSVGVHEELIHVPTASSDATSAHYSVAGDLVNADTDLKDKQQLLDAQAIAAEVKSAPTADTLITETPLDDPPTDGDVVADIEQLLQNQSLPPTEIPPEIREVQFPLSRDDGIVVNQPEVSDNTADRLSSFTEVQPEVLKSQAVHTHDDDTMTNQYRDIDEPSIASGTESPGGKIVASQSLSERASYTPSADVSAAISTTTSPDQPGAQEPSQQEVDRQAQTGEPETDNVVAHSENHEAAADTTSIEAEKLALERADPTYLLSNESVASGSTTDIQNSRSARSDSEIEELKTGTVQSDEPTVTGDATSDFPEAVKLNDDVLAALDEHRNNTLVEGQSSETSQTEELEADLLPPQQYQPFAGDQVAEASESHDESLTLQTGNAEAETVQSGEERTHQSEAAAQSEPLHSSEILEASTSEALDELAAVTQAGDAGTSANAPPGSSDADDHDSKTPLEFYPEPQIASEPGGASVDEVHVGKPSSQTAPPNQIGVEDQSSELKPDENSLGPAVDVAVTSMNGIAADDEGVNTDEQPISLTHDALPSSSDDVLSHALPEESPSTISVGAEEPEAVHASSEIKTADTQLHDEDFTNARVVGETGAVLHFHTDIVQQASSAEGSGSSTNQPSQGETEMEADSAFTSAPTEHILVSNVMDVHDSVDKDEQEHFSGTKEVADHSETASEMPSDLSQSRTEADHSETASEMPSDLSRSLTEAADIGEANAIGVVLLVSPGAANEPQPEQEQEVGQPLSVEAHAGSDITPSEPPASSVASDSVQSPATDAKPADAPSELAVDETSTTDVPAEHQAVQASPGHPLSEGAPGHSQDDGSAPVNDGENQGSPPMHKDYVVLGNPPDETQSPKVLPEPADKLSRQGSQLSEDTYSDDPSWSGESSADKDSPSEVASPEPAAAAAAVTNSTSEECPKDPVEPSTSLPAHQAAAAESTTGAGSPALSSSTDGETTLQHARPSDTVEQPHLDPVKQDNGASKQAADECTAAVPSGAVDASVGHPDPGTHDGDIGSWIRKRQYLPAHHGPLTSSVMTPVPPSQPNDRAHHHGRDYSRTWNASTGKPFHHLQATGSRPVVPDTAAPPKAAATTPMLRKGDAVGKFVGNDRNVRPLIGLIRNEHAAVWHSDAAPGLHPMLVPHPPPPRPVVHIPSAEDGSSMSGATSAMAAEPSLRPATSLRPGHRVDGVGRHGITAHLLRPPQPPTSPRPQEPVRLFHRRVEIRAPTPPTVEAQQRPHTAEGTPHGRVRSGPRQSSGNHEAIVRPRSQTTIADLRAVSRVEHLPRLVPPRTAPSRYFSVAPSDLADKRKDYYKEELLRLQRNMDREAERAKAYRNRDTHLELGNSLEPYYNTSDVMQALEEVQEKRPLSNAALLHYSSRPTALGLVDPWVNLRMDAMMLPRITTREQAILKELLKKSKSSGTTAKSKRHHPVLLVGSNQQPSRKRRNKRAIDVDTSPVPHNEDNDSSELTEMRAIDQQSAAVIEKDETARLDHRARNPENPSSSPDSGNGESYHQPYHHQGHFSPVLQTDDQMS